MLHVAGLLVMMLQTAWLQAGGTVITAVAASASAPAGQPGRWQLLFSDEFDGSSLDGKKWVTCYWWNQNGCTNLGNHELQWYRPQNVTVAAGQLRLRARRESARGHDDVRYDYTSGLVSTGRDVEDVARPTRFDFQYGYLEMRARIPAGRGLFPALWMLPADHESKPEIDVMEVLGQEPRVLHTYFHYRDAAAGIDRRQGRDSATVDLSAGWHVFGVDWRPDRIVWYLDGVERWRYQDADHIPHEPMYILINLAVGGKWPGSPDSSTGLPADLLVDYVRVWRRID
jgi:beta-glucanase (GH16 family)